MGDINQGAVAIEAERAIAEARGQMQLAKMFPRSEAAARAKLIEACKSKEFAESAFYAVKNRGSGPSIRFAEEVARVYGNFQYGHRELSRSEGRSEVEVYAWDVENNNYSKRQITVLHVRDTKEGAYPLRDQADIDNRIANVASKQMRGRILALVSKQLVAEGIAECKRTIAGTNDEPISVRVGRMVQAFARYGVTVDHLKAYVGHELDNTTADELVDLIGVFNAIRDGAKVADYFQLPQLAQAGGGAKAELDSLLPPAAAPAAVPEQAPEASTAKAAAAAKPAETKRRTSNDAKAESNSAKDQPPADVESSSTEPTAEAPQEPSGDYEPMF